MDPKKKKITQSQDRYCGWDMKILFFAKTAKSEGMYELQCCHITHDSSFFNFQTSSSWLIDFIVPKQHKNTALMSDEPALIHTWESCLSCLISLPNFLQSQRIWCFPLQWLMLCFLTTGINQLWLSWCYLRSLDLFLPFQKVLIVHSVLFLVLS